MCICKPAHVKGLTQKQNELCLHTKLDLESIGSSLGFVGELIWAGLDWRGPNSSSWLVNRHLI